MVIKSKGGRPTVMTQLLVNKLEEIFAIGGTDEEACLYAGISRQTLYDYQTKNPEYLDRKELLKENPFLKARRTIFQALNNPKDAQWYMERKKKKEFTQKTEISGSEDRTPIICITRYDQAKTTDSIQAEKQI